MARSIYVCHPFRCDPERNAVEIGSLARGIAKRGFVPLAPQIYLPEFLDETTEREVALSCCLTLLALSDEFWVYGGPTEGMRLEIAEARRLGIPVIYHTREGARR